MDRSDVPLRSSVSAALSALKHARDVLGNRIRRDEPKMGGKTTLMSERCLLNRCGRSQCSFYRESPPGIYVIAHEAFAFSCDRAPDIARDRTVAAEDFGAAIVDVEGVNAQRCHGKVS